MEDQTARRDLPVLSQEGTPTVDPATESEGREDTMGPIATITVNGPRRMARILTCHVPTSAYPLAVTAIRAKLYPQSPSPLETSLTSRETI